jgi:hypothetical protein
VDKIAATLGETEQMPLETIQRVVEVIGEEKALAILEETVQVEAEGGMLTNDGQQRRTPGGVYFKLVKLQTPSKERQEIFAPAWAAAVTPPEPVTWEDSQHLSDEALESEKGEASTVKVTIIGRPGRVIEKGNVVITSMQNSKAPALPKGLPKPPDDPTTYVIYIAMKQWQKIKESVLNNPNDRLIIEGYPRFDRRIGKNGAMTIFALNATSKLTQQGQRRRK